ncbi:hypothetical protein YC2023_079491 [Brassica napus]
MVSVKKIPRKSTRVTRKPIRSTDVDDSPPPSPPVAQPRNTGAPRMGFVMFKLVLIKEDLSVLSATVWVILLKDAIKSMDFHRGLFPNTSLSHQEIDFRSLNKWQLKYLSVLRTQDSHR